MEGLRCVVSQLQEDSGRRSGKNNPSSSIYFATIYLYCSTSFQCQRHHRWYVLLCNTLRTLTYLSEIDSKLNAKKRKASEMEGGDLSAAAKKRAKPTPRVTKGRIKGGTLHLLLQALLTTVNRPR